MRLPQMLSEAYDAYKDKVVFPSENLLHKTTGLLQNGMNARAFGEYPSPEALGDARWTDELILSTWYMAETGEVPSDMNFKTGKSDGGFDRLDFQFLSEEEWREHAQEIDTSIPLNRRADGKNEIGIDIPWYGGGM